MDRLRRLLPYLAVAAVAALVYANALANRFAYDDLSIIVFNPVVHGFGDLRGILLGSYWPDSTELYRPVTLFSFALDWSLWGRSEEAFHAVNVLAHAVVTVLVLRLLLRLRAERDAAVVGALVFAVHPVHVEAVSNVVGRAEILAAGFFLAACLLSLSRRLPAPPRVAGVAACYLLALGSKEIAVTLPAVLVALHAFDDPERAGALRRSVRRLLPTLAATAAALAVYLALRTYVLGVTRGSGAAAYLEALSTADRLATAVRLWLEFARLLFWPATLSVEWGPAVLNPTRWSDPLVYLGLLLGAGVVWLAWRERRGNGWVTLAVAWFVLTFLTISQLFFPIGVLIAERTLYLPSVAVALLVPGVAAWLARAGARSRPLVAGVVALVLVLGVLRTWTRTPVWKNSDTVFASLLEEHPRSFRVIWNGAAIYARMGRFDEARQLYGQASEMVGGTAYLMNIEHAEVLLAAGRPAEAERLLRETMPRAASSDRGYVLWSAALLRQGRPREALARLELGRRHVASPRLAAAAAHHAALAYQALGRPDSAWTARVRADSLPGNRRLAQHWFHLAALAEARGETATAAAARDSAAAVVRAAGGDPSSLALTLDPPGPEGLLAWGWAPTAGGLERPAPRGAAPGAGAPEMRPGVGSGPARSRGP